jgi:hypothetical protein
MGGGIGYTGLITEQWFLAACFCFGLLNDPKRLDEAFILWQNLFYTLVPGKTSFHHQPNSEKTLNHPPINVIRHDLLYTVESP